MNATKTRKYPELEVSNKVKIFKKKDKLDKERVSSWSANSYTIDDIKTVLCPYIVTLMGVVIYDMNC